MKLKTTLFSVSLLLISAFVINSTIKIHHEETAIKELLETGYVHGAFNELNPEAMTKTFHKDFAIFSPGKDGEINKYPIDRWVEGTKKRKASAEFDASKNVWEHKFKRVDVSGKAAHVELELHKDGNLVFTDYLSLLKFEDDWKVVAKVYHRHETP